MNNFELIERAQKSAPSYLKLRDDGADFRCELCNENPGRKGFVVPYTPDGKNHMSCHKSCLDEEWLANALDMGSL